MKFTLCKAKLEFSLLWAINFTVRFRMCLRTAWNFYGNE